ncbi:YciI family protein [Sphingobium aromaticivastans]|uniref:YciI family protein n=1 Tax=Sphingobium aromaticivastans TaxID=1778665 RepID=UPI003017678A
MQKSMLVAAAMMFSIANTADMAAAQTPKKAETVYVAMCQDKPDGVAMRYGPKGVIKAHLDYIDSIKGKVAIGGPSYSSADKKGVHGSVIVYHAADLAEARTLLEKDPLYPVFQSCQWDSFSAYVGTYVGGWAGPYKKSAQ